MFFDRPQIAEGSVIINATIPSGPSFPADPSPGELFYLTTGEQGFYYYAGDWTRISSAGELLAHMADDSRHLTSDQNVLIDGITVTSTDINSIPTLKSRIDQHQVDISNHVNDQNIHVTAAQKTLLNGLSPGLTAAELNFVDGVTSAIQTQLDNLASKNTQQDSDISNLASSSSTGTAAVQSDLDAHKADDSRHLTVTQNAWIDAITSSADDVNKLGGLATFLGASALSTYLNGLNNGKLNINGTNAMTANLSVGGFKLVNVGTPTQPTDGANKQYVDNFAQGIHWVQSARVATTGNITLSGLQTIDGFALSAGHRVLVKDQTDARQNGVWLAASGAWTRADDYNSSAEIASSAIFVVNGDTQAKSTWVQTETGPVIDTDPITFTVFSGPSITVGGAGVSIVGTATLALDLLTNGGLFLTVDGTNAAPSNIDAKLALTNVGTAGTYRSVTTDAKGRVTAGTNPTTLAGYGITDAATTTQVNGKVSKTGDNMTGGLVIGVNSTSDVAGLPSTGSLGLNGTGATSIASVVGHRNNVVGWRIDMPSSSTNGDFNIHRFNASGTYVDTPFIIDRSSGNVTVGLPFFANNYVQTPVVVATNGNITNVNGTNLYGVFASIGNGTNGRVSLQQGNASNSGYIEFSKGSPLVRQGYIGFSGSTATTTDNGSINYVATAGHNFTGPITSSGDITAFSDERLKEDIRPINFALAIVEELRGVSFTKDGKRGIGVIAQEVQKHLPEVVHQGEEYLSVAYGNMVGLLIEAVKELSARVKELEGNQVQEPWPFPTSKP